MLSVRRPQSMVAALEAMNMTRFNKWTVALPNGLVGQAEKILLRPLKLSRISDEMTWMLVVGCSMLDVSRITRHART